VSDPVFLLAPEVAWQTGVITRLRRYERALMARGLTVRSQAFRTTKWPHCVQGHTHVLDPVALVDTLVRMAGRGEGVGDLWWPPILSPYTVTVSRPLEAAGEHMARLAAQLVQGARAVLVGSQASASALVTRHGIAPERIALAPTPLQSLPDSHVCPEIEKRIDAALSGHRRMLLCVSALGNGRGIERFLRLVEATRYVHMDVIGLLVGPVIDTHFTRELIPRLARCGVSYAGAVDRTCMAQFYAPADVLLQTDRDAALSACVGEALAESTPVIAHRSAWDEWIRPGNLELYQEEGEALRLIDARLRMPRRIITNSTASVAGLAPFGGARADIEAQHLYDFATCRCIDGEISVG